MKIKWNAARVNAGLTIDDAAEKLGKSKNTLISYEKYKTFPPMDTAQAMASLYGASLDDIIFLPNDCALSTTAGT